MGYINETPPGGSGATSKPTNRAANLRIRRWLIGRTIFRNLHDLNRLVKDWSSQPCYPGTDVRRTTTQGNRCRLPAAAVHWAPWLSLTPAAEMKPAEGARGCAARPTRRSSSTVRRSRLPDYRPSARARRSAPWPLLPTPSADLPPPEAGSSGRMRPNRDRSLLRRDPATCFLPSISARSASEEKHLKALGSSSR